MHKLHTQSWRYARSQAQPGVDGWYVHSLSDAIRHKCLQTPISFHALLFRIINVGLSLYVLIILILQARTSARIFTALLSLRSCLTWHLLCASSPRGVGLPATVRRHSSFCILCVLYKASYIPFTVNDTFSESYLGATFISPYSLHLIDCHLRFMFRSWPHILAASLGLR